ncbi:MAG: T9SS C-terminal target domain-containing protein [Candidatus Kapaibacterium sp.]|nr:MAG: T9SS C-terminal target domain-containing protein [Candidatus Kapabacteria bacterium]
MLKRFSVLLVALFALSAGIAKAQTFGFSGPGLTWNNGPDWTATGGASGYPGQVANNGDVTISVAATFSATPANPISSLSVNTPVVVGVGAGTLIITGNLSVANGATLNIPAGATVIVNGTTTLNGTITVNTATSRLQINGPISGGGIINGTTPATAPNYNVQFGAAVTSIPGAIFQIPFPGVINTGGSANLTSSLIIGGTGAINLVGTLTLGNNVTFDIRNNASTAINPAGTAGNFQGATATSLVDFSTSGPTAVNGTWFANPFNGRFQSSGGGTSTLSGTMTVGATGFLDLRAQLNIAAAANLILNNSAPNSLTGSGTVNMLNMSNVTLGPGFNGGTVNFDRFVSPIVGTLNTGGNLIADGAATPIATIGNAGNGVLNLTGTLTIASGKTLRIAGTSAGALTGSGTFAAAAASSTVEFNPNTANAGNVPGVNFSNPWNGTLNIAGAMGLSSSMTVGGPGILALSGNFTVAANQTLTLNCSNPVATAITGTGRIAGAAASSTIEIGNNTFAGFLPADKLGAAANTWAAGDGILRLLGSSTLNHAAATYTVGGILELAPAAVLTVATGKTIDITGTLARQSIPAPTASTGMGRINGQDNTAVVILNTTTFNNNTGTGAATNIPGAVFGTPNFDGQLRVAGARTLAGNLRIGANGILDMASAAMTINNNAGPPVRNDTLFLNPTATGGLVNPGTFSGNGTVFLGNNALGAVYPTTPLAGFSGRTIVGDNIRFTANTPLPANMILQLNGPTEIAGGVTLTVNNVAANSLTGVGTIQGVNNTAILSFANGANNNVIPGANIFGNPNASANVNTFNGRLNVAAGATRNLTGNLNIGPNAIIDLANDISLSQTSLVRLQMTAGETASWLGAPGRFVGQPGTNTPELVISTNAFASVIPGAARLSLGNTATQFGGRLTIGTGFSVNSANYPASLTVGPPPQVSGTPLTISDPATLNLVTNATLTIGAGAGILFDTRTSPMIGPNSGIIQGANNTAIVAMGSNTAPILTGPIQGRSFANPFNGSFVVNASIGLSDSLRMSATSLLTLNNNLNVNAGATLQLDGGVNTVQGAGVLNGSNNRGRVILGNGFNGTTLQASRFGSPFNGFLDTRGPMNLVGALTIGNTGGLALGGNMSIPASTALTMQQTDTNSFVVTNNAIFTGTANSRIILGSNLNNRLLPGAAFRDFAGQIQLGSPMSLTSALLLRNATGQLDLGGNGNPLSLGNHNLAIVNPILSTSATSFVVTNGIGTMSVSNATLTSVFFPIGTTSASYTPFTVRSTSGTADIYIARVREIVTPTNTPLPLSPNQFDGFVAREWLVSSNTPTVVRGMSFNAQWAANLERLMFTRNSVGLAAFAPTTSVYLQSATTGTSIGPNGELSVSGNIPPLAYSDISILVYSRRPTFVAPVNPLAPTIASFSPSTFPASNDPVLMDFIGANLNLPAPNNVTVTARNLVSGVTVRATTNATLTGGTRLSLIFPGVIRNVPGTVNIMITSANLAFTSANITITPVTSPTITSFSPATTASGRSFALNITGTGFFTNATISIGGLPARILGATSATSAVIEFPANLNATSNTVRIVIGNANNLATSATYTVAPPNRPFITSVSPRAVFVNSLDTEVTINGTGFFGQGFITAFYSASLIPVRVVSSTQVVVTIPASLLNVVGNPSILLSNSDLQNIGHVFTVLERAPLGPTPNITAISPSVTTASFRAFSVNLTGENFNPSALVTVLGQLVTVTSRTGTTGLSLEIPAGLNTTTNTYEVVLQNPDLQFTSATVRIGDRLNAPALGSIFPQVTVASLQPRPFTITIRGTNFTPDAVILLNGTPLQIVSTSTTELRAIVPTNVEGAYTLQVLNGDGQVTPPISYAITNKVTIQTLPDVSVYPSPVIDNMTITAGFATPVTLQVTITNVVGQRVMSFTDKASGAYNRTVNMSNMPTGAYIVEISDGARRMVQKIVKY